MKKEEIPFVAFGNDEIENAPEAEAFYKCPRCKKEHPIKFGTTNGKENKLLGYVNCGKESYLATINGKLV